MRNVPPKPTLCVTLLYSHTSLDVALPRWQAEDYLTKRDTKGPQPFQSQEARRVMYYSWISGPVFLIRSCGGVIWSYFQNKAFFPPLQNTTILPVQCLQCWTTLSHSLSWLSVWVFMQCSLHTGTQHLESSTKAGGLVWGGKKRRKKKGHVQSVQWVCDSGRADAFLRACKYTHTVWNVTLLCQGKPKYASPVTTKMRMSITVWSSEKWWSTDFNRMA